jgi:hypothetical protein
MSDIDSGWHAPAVATATSLRWRPTNRLREIPTPAAAAV